MTSVTAQLKERLATVWKVAINSPLFDEITLRPPHILKRGTMIFSEGDPLNRLYYIHQGFVKLHRISKEGREATSYLLGPGYILGIRALTSEDECAKHNAKTLTDVTVITISRNEFLDFVEKRPEIVVDLLQAFIERLNYTEKKLEGFMLTDSTARVAYFLADCAQRFCDTSKQPIILPLRLTHQLIADFVGSVRETITIVLNKLQHDKVITIKQRYISIIDLKKLQSYTIIERNL